MGNSIDKCSRITEDKIDKKLYKYKGCIQSAATNVNDRVKYLKSTDPNYKILIPTIVVSKTNICVYYNCIHVMTLMPITNL